MFSAVLIVLLLIGRGFSQCYTDSACGGTAIAATDQRACCVGTDNGLSYNDGTSCNLCIGNYTVIGGDIVKFNPAVHGFLRDAYSVSEGDRLDASFQLNVKGTTQFSGALVVSGLITAAADGTASKTLCSFI